jgi:hypothetical protein
MISASQASIKKLITPSVVSLEFLSEIGVLPILFEKFI